MKLLDTSRASDFLFGPAGWTAWLAFAVLLLSSAAGWAKDEPAAPQVQVTARLIYASKNGHQIDEQLKFLADNLSTLSYTRFALIGVSSLDVAMGGAGRFAIPDSQESMNITPLQYEEKQTAPGKTKRFIRLKVTTPWMNVLLRIPDGGTLIVGGPKYRDGVMVIALSAATAGQALGAQPPK